MKLTSEQKQTVTAWVADGATLNEIQDRLKSELGVVLSFMDTRFLLSDLGLTLKPPPEDEDEDASPEPADDGALTPESDAWLPPDDPEAEAAPDAGTGPARVHVTVDAVTVPGTMVSGKVTFSDGVSGGWYLDQMGQLGLTGIPRTYQPPEADVVAFQSELRRALR